MGKYYKASLWLASFLNTLGCRAKLMFHTYRIQIVIATLLFILVAPVVAYAFDPNAGARSVLSFAKFVLLIFITVSAGMLLARSQVVGALTLIIVSALIYVVIDENMMKVLGQGLTNLMGMNGDG